jgi:opacity protein-like surface antigen
LDIDRTAFAYRLMAGLSHPIGRRLALTAQYRWFDAGTINGRGERATRDIAGHKLDVGLRYAF